MTKRPATGAGGRRGVRSRLSPGSRLAALDWIRIGLLAVGVGFVVTGLLPTREAAASVLRVAPLLAFLVAVIVLAQLTRDASVFDVVATRLAIVGRGSYFALFLLSAAFAALTTTFLNLDTTAVLLTPVMLALAPKARVAPLPLAMTTVWLANTASNLLPVSNLTNLLAAGRVALSPTQFAGRMWAPDLASIVVAMLFLWALYWRRGLRSDDRYSPPPRVAPKDPVLFWVAGLACLLFAAGILAALPVAVPATGAAALVVGAFLIRDRSRLRPGLVPWRLLVFVPGLFLVVPTLDRFGLREVMTALVGVDGHAWGIYRAAVAGGCLSNLLNNLPAYTAGEAVIPDNNRDQLLGLLIGTNVAPVVTPWASLATLLWFESCRRHAVSVPLCRFMLSGLAPAVVGLAAAVGALLGTR